MSAQSWVTRRADAATRPSAGRARRLVLAQIARAEAGRLARSPWVLAGFLVAAWLVLRNTGDLVPLWWVADIGIGSALLAGAGGVLIAAHLAAGRAGRDGMTGLYASYPASPAVRVGGQLLGVTGPVALAGLVTCGAVLWLDSRGAVGSPAPDVLAGGLLLVAAAGALGVALGTWLPHPMVGILVAVVLGLIEFDVVLTFNGWILPPGTTGWLFPWYQPGYVLSSLPGINVPLPPLAHVAELAGLTGLAAAAALWRAVSGREARAGGEARAGRGARAGREARAGRRIVAALAAACLAVTVWSGWSQTRPVPFGRLSALAGQVMHPRSYQHCAVRRDVRYCFYPAFAAMPGRWAVPVDGVLAGLPARPGRPLVIRQVVDENNGQILSPPLTVLPYVPHTSADRRVIHLNSQLQRYQNAESENPALLSGSNAPPVYVDLDWGRGSAAGNSQFGLALSTAFWVTGLPTTNTSKYLRFDGGSGIFDISCLPVGQAREPIALWLAASATAAARAAFAAEQRQASAVTVGGRSLATDNLQGSGAALNLPVTAQGALLARAMLRLPRQRVESVLAARWPGWLRATATAAQLAAALHLPLPAPPAPPAAPSDEISPNPPSPVCR